MEIGLWPGVEGTAMASPKLLHYLLLPSSSGTQPFLRTFSLSDAISALVRMCVPDTIRSVGVHGAMGLAGLLGWVGLIHQ